MVAAAWTIVLRPNWALSKLSPPTHLNERRDGLRFGERVVTRPDIVLARLGDVRGDVCAGFERYDAIFAGESRVRRGVPGGSPHIPG
jgi:hypothetical protein